MKKSSVRKLKCGGLKANKKYQGGGEIISQLAGGDIGKQIQELISKNIQGALDSLKDDYDDVRVNPMESMKRNDSIDVAKEVFTGNFSALLGSKKRKKERIEKVNEWQQGWSSASAQGLSSQSYKKGGKVGNPKDRSKPGGSNVGKYSKSEGPFAGPSGGSPKGSYPIGSRKRAKSALKLAHNAPNPSGIKAAVYRKYPDLKKSAADGGFKLSTGMGKSYAKGGKVVGKGTAKSDSIKKNVEDGSFIVPAENAAKAMKIGKEYLNWKDNEMASRSYPGTEVNLSNGEVLFTREEVNKLRYEGMDEELRSLAPNATETIEPGANLQEGTETKLSVWGKAQLPFTSTKAVSTGNAKTPEFSSIMPGIQKNVHTKTKKNPKSALRTVLGLRRYKNEKDEKEEGNGGILGDLAMMLPGMVQTGMAIKGLSGLGKMPEVAVSSYLNKLISDQTKRAEYGLEPGAKDAMRTAAERTRRDFMNAISQSGGTPMQKQIDMQGLLATSIAEKMKIELADVSELARKQSERDKSVLAAADQDFTADTIALQNWRDMQEVNAGLLSAGISNIVGAKKYRDTQETLRRIGNSNPKMRIGDKDVEFE